ncbi:MAG: hypothetical protein R3F20_06595 [Planctomycetota bacterium]
MFETAFFAAAFNPIALGSAGPFLFFVMLFVGVLWLFQIYRLLTIEEAYFPGPHARLAWALVFVFVWFAAPFLFLLWLSRRSRQLRSERRLAAREEQAESTRPS